MRFLELALVNRWTGKGLRAIDHRLLPDPRQCVKDIPLWQMPLCIRKKQFFVVKYLLFFCMWPLIDYILQYFFHSWYSWKQCRTYLKWCIRTAFCSLFQSSTICVHLCISVVLLENLERNEEEDEKRLKNNLILKKTWTRIKVVLKRYLPHFLITLRIFGIWLKD